MKYITPELELIALNDTDVIATSFLNNGYGEGDIIDFEDLIKKA